MQKQCKKPVNEFEGRMQCGKTLYFNLTSVVFNIYVCIYV